MSQPQQVAPDIYLVDAVGAPFKISTLLLRDGERWVLVDTGLSFSPERIQRALASLGGGLESLRAIFITHHHIDHVGGLNGIRRLAPAAEIWTTAHEAGIVSGEEPPDEPSNPLFRRAFKLQIHFPQVAGMSRRIYAARANQRGDLRVRSRQRRKQRVPDQHGDRRRRLWRR